MKIFIITLLSIQTAMAATVTVPKFDITFFVKKDSFDIDFELKMACRYEKFVIGDSAQYEYSFKDVPLEARVTKYNNELDQVNLINKSDRRHEVSGWFKPNKSCQTMQKFFIASKLYSIGYANGFDRPIRLGLFDHSRLMEASVYDVEGLRDTIENKEMGFVYKYVYRAVHTRLAFDGIAHDSMSFYARTSVLGNEETQMPYPLQK